MKEWQKERYLHRHDEVRTDVEDSPKVAVRVRLLPIVSISAAERRKPVSGRTEYKSERERERDRRSYANVLLVSGIGLQLRDALLCLIVVRPAAFGPTTPHKTSKRKSSSEK
jgi:hypothetical protein